MASFIAFKSFLLPLIFLVNEVILNTVYGPQTIHVLKILLDSSKAEHKHTTSQVLFMTKGFNQ